MKKKILLVIIIIVVLLILGIIGFLYSKSYNSNVKFNIKVVGIKNTSFNESILKDVKQETKEFTMDTAYKKQTNEYTVISMSEVLKKLSIKEYKSMIMISKDGYSNEIDKKDINESFFAVLKDGEGPVKAIVPNKNSKFWVSNIVKIQVK